MRRRYELSNCQWERLEYPQSEDPLGDNLCAVGGTGYHRRGRPAGVGRVERPRPEELRRQVMLTSEPICVPPATGPSAGPAEYDRGPASTGSTAEAPASPRRSPGPAPDRRHGLIKGGAS